MKTALLFGATGLVGRELLKRLLNDPHYGLVKIFLRKKLTVKHLNASVHQVNFESLADAASSFSGDDCFCALGTTMKTAGSKEAFRKVDYEYVLNVARLAKQQGVKRFIVVSSIGANAHSSNFYLKTKGEMEAALQQLGFEQILIVRPSILLGKRKEVRIGEHIGIFFARMANPFMFGPLDKYRPIKARVVAKAMINLANLPPEKEIYESGELQEYGR